MLDGNDVNVDTIDGGVFINNAMVATANQTADNGTIHIIDRVLRQPTSSATVSLDDDGFTITEDLIDAASLAATVNTPGLTLLAPTNAAWNSLMAPNDLAFYQNPANVADLTTLLQRHVFTGGEVTASAAVAAGDVASAEGGLLFFANDAGPVTVNGVQVSSPNRPTTGALIHGIDGVLEDPGTIVDVATANGSFGTLLTEVTEAGLAGTLAGPGPFTVFAPTDTAITNWVTANGNTDVFSNGARQAEATDILEFHVVSGNAVQEGEVVTLSSVDTIEGTVFISVNGMGQVELTDTMGGTAQATITATNVYGNNGVIHVIDSVLVPTTVTP